MSKKNIVEVLALIDRSGSMGGIMLEAVNAFNTFIDEQKKEKIDDKVFVTLAAFDDRYEVVFDHINIKDVPQLTVQMVEPRGMTVLNDSIGKIITEAKYPKRPTVLLIQTDGMENSSHEYSTQRVKELIEQKKKDGWDISFIGSGLSEQEVQTAALTRGILGSKTVAFAKSADGMDALKSYYSTTTSSVRTSTTTTTTK